MESHMSSHNERHQFNDLQSLLCGTLQSVLRNVREDDVPKISDAIMNAWLNIINSCSGKSGGAQEDAFLAVGTLVELLGVKFVKYMDDFKPYLYMGLKNHQEYQVCWAAVILAGEISRALRQLIIPYCDEIMTFLLATLSVPTLHRSVKPQILSVFGDMALSIGGEFVKYLNVVLEILRAASQSEVDPNNYDMVDYLNELRESVLESYTGIVKGLMGVEQTPNSNVYHLEPHLGHIIMFIKRIAIEGDNSDYVVASVADFLDDLCFAFGPRLLELVDDVTITQFLAEGKRSKVSRTKSLCNLATKAIQKLRDHQTIAQ